MPLQRERGPVAEKDNQKKETSSTRQGDLRGSPFLHQVMDRHGSSRLSSGGARCKPPRTAPWAGTATDHPSVVGLRAFAGTLKVSLLLVVVMPFKRESCGYALKVANSAARPTGAGAGAGAGAGGRAITSTPSSAYVNLPFCRRRCFYCDFPIKVREIATGISECVTL